jgi:hypothetical protein
VVILSLRQYNCFDPGVWAGWFIGFLLSEAADSEPKMDVVRDADAGGRTGAGRSNACGRCLVAVDGSVCFSFLTVLSLRFSILSHLEYLCL